MKKIASVSEIINDQIAQSWDIFDPYDGVIEKNSCFRLQDVGELCLLDLHSMVVKKFVDMLIYPDLGSYESFPYKNIVKSCWDTCSTAADREKGYQRYFYTNLSGVRTERVFQIQRM